MLSQIPAKTSDQARAETKPSNIEKGAQFARVVRVLKLAERVGLDLPDSLNPTAKLCIAATLAFSDGALVQTRTVLS